MTDWKPIETAPKDGTSVLLFIPKTVECQAHQALGWWDEKFDQIGLTRGGNPKYRAAWTDGTVASWGYEENTELHPTHWMPLPPAPIS